MTFVLADASGTVVAPEDHPRFRLAQLLLLLRSPSLRLANSHIERLAYYDFFSANPHLLISPEEPEHGRLLMAGFDPQALSNASPGHRFSSRRQRLQHDLSHLLAYGLVRVQRIPGHVVYGLTESGSELAGAFTALYARSYAISADTVIKRLQKLSDSRLRDQARQWLRAPDTLLDLVERAPAAEARR